MRRRDTYWSLFHKSEKRQIDDLKTDAIETIHEVVPAKDHDDWLVWREGFATWKPLADFPTLLTSLRKGGMMTAPSQPAPAPAQRDIPTRMEPDQRAPQKVSDQKSSGDTTTIEKRLERQGSVDSTVAFEIGDADDMGLRDERYRKKWTIRIPTDGKPILLTTVDVSNRGFSLKDPLPKGLPRYFNVEAVVGNIVVPLICSEIASKDGQPSTRLRIEVNHDPSLFQAALLQ